MSESPHKESSRKKCKTKVSPTQESDHKDNSLRSDDKEADLFVLRRKRVQDYESSDDDDDDTEAKKDPEESDPEESYDKEEEQ